MFRKVPTKQVNRLAKYKNITTRSNPHSYKVLPSSAPGEMMIGNSMVTSTSAEVKCYFSMSCQMNLASASSSSSTSGVDDSSIVYVNSAKKAPRAIGPYSQGVKANGNFYISGCLGIDGEVNVVKTTVLLTDINDFQAVNEVYSEYFSGDNKPARVCYAASGLPKKAKVEIEAIAVYKE
ncbi:predicted protein [Naegleria gruberi]|uniref:Predicted protein n=1 Tax=Naegleria gruberi TaxID=5762 RepID=D2W3G7_NAEGR|nr:uncharacterized protein NAEGRDRAFT_75938 [Naegleria gruberi]EFC36419.1 predicted protein [Naegleria gruberi]|eukprot:XP_002669163.1 predicted protein [Naegleria gruberi strain NEG-M]